MEKFRDSFKKKKKIEIPNKILIKSYITGIVFSFILILPFVLFLINILIFERFLTYIQVGFFICANLFILLVLIFKDKALEVYIPEFRNINLFLIRIFIYMLITILMIIIGIFYFTVFRWW